MSSDAVDLCLDEVQEVSTQLLARLTALQAYAGMGVSDATKAWLETDMSLVRDRLSLLDSLQRWLLTVQGTDHPTLDHAPIADEVHADLEALRMALEAAADATLAQMALVFPSATLTSGSLDSRVEAHIADAPVEDNEVL